MALTFSTALEPVQSLASKGETRRKQAKKRNVQVVHEHFELVFNAVSLKRRFLEEAGKTLYYNQSEAT